MSELSRQESPLCLAPWRAISIRPNGNVLPDGQYETPLGNINNQTLPEILGSQETHLLKKHISQGQFPQACHSCQKKEKSIGHSRRIFFEHKLRQFNQNIQVDQDSPTSIHYLDLNLSNKCNLKCRMCSSHSSSAWVAEEKIFLKRQHNNFRLNKYPKLHEVEYDNVLKNLNYPEYFKDLRGIALQGGEPLLQERNLEVLQLFADWGIANQVTIDLSTNGSVISPQVQKLISQFKQVDLYISIEGVGPLYQYIRGGKSFPIELLENNLNKFRSIPNLNLSFAVTSCVYNILYLSDLINWFEDVRMDGEEIIMSNTVVRPEYLSFHILPTEIKKVALERLKASNVLEKIDFGSHRRIGDPGKSLICEALETEIYSPQEKETLFTQFLDFNNSVDELRGTSLADVIPEFSTLLSRPKPELTT